MAEIVTSTFLTQRPANILCHHTLACCVRYNGVLSKVAKNGASTWCKEGKPTFSVGHIGPVGHGGIIGHVGRDEHGGIGVF